MVRTGFFAALSSFFLGLTVSGPALTDGPYCPRDRESDCPSTGLADGCCWDMHFDFDRGSVPNLALGEQSNINDRFAPFGIRFGDFLLPDLTTGV